MKIEKNSSKKKKIIVALAVIIAIGASYLAFAKIKNLPPFASANPTYQPGEYVTNMERTDAEKQASKQLSEHPESKTENNQNDAPPTPTINDTTGKQAVNILLTNAGITNGQVSASGFVTNIAESNGSCEYVFTSGSLEVRKTAGVLTNPTSTTCKTVSFPVNELPAKGVWKVTLSYSSSTSSGQSTQKEFAY